MSPRCLSVDIFTILTRLLSQITGLRGGRGGPPTKPQARKAPFGSFAPAAVVARRRPFVSIASTPSATKSRDAQLNSLAEFLSTPLGLDSRKQNFICFCSPVKTRSRSQLLSKSCNCLSSPIIIKFCGFLLRR